MTQTRWGAMQLLNAPFAAETLAVAPTAASERHGESSRGMLACGAASVWRCEAATLRKGCCLAAPHTTHDTHDRPHAVQCVTGIPPRLTLHGRARCVGRDRRLDLADARYHPETSNILWFGV
eukprot:1153416-Pleurochrysis_carterae.AAC.3